MMTTGNLNFNSGAEVVGNVHVPGTPELKVKGNGSYLGTVEGTGNTDPSNYKVQINGSSSIGYLYNREDGQSLPTVADPPEPVGTVSVTINQPGEVVGDFSDINDLTLSNDVGIYDIPSGTYGNFTAHGGSGFRLGVANSSSPAIYNFQRLDLNGDSSLEVAGPVIVTLKDGSSFNSDEIGNIDHPDWLFLNVAHGGINLNNGVLFYGHLLVPDGNVGIHSYAVLAGTVTSKDLNLSANGLIVGLPLDTTPPVNEAPTANADALAVDEDQALSITLQGADPEGALLTFTVVDPSSIGTLSGAAPNLTYTPDADVNGLDQFTFIVNDGDQDSSLATVTIDILPVNDTPVANTQNLTTPEDVPLQFTLTGSDIENDPLTFSITQNPSNGHLPEDHLPDSP